MTSYIYGERVQRADKRMKFDSYRKIENVL